jgi:hypothetical protein
MERLYLKPSLCKAIAEYCEANKIDDINAFANRCAMQGLSIVKYGMSPSDNIDRENNGIKDFKNEKGSRKKKEPPTKDEGEQAKERRSDIPEERKEESEPVKEGKSPITVRKIRIIKKE